MRATVRHHPPPRPPAKTCQTTHWRAASLRSATGRTRREPKPLLQSGGGRNSGVPPAPASPAPAPCSSIHSRTSSSDIALTASSSSAPSAHLPTSVVERKSSTARLHLPSASRSRTFHRSFHLPVSFFTSAHRIFCCGFHSGHSLKRWYRVKSADIYIERCSSGTCTYLHSAFGTGTTSIAGWDGSLSS